MWPLAGAVNPGCWVWYKQDLAITMILTSVRTVQWAPKRRQQQERNIFLLIKKRQKQSLDSEPGVSAPGINQYRMFCGLENLCLVHYGLCKMFFPTALHSLCMWRITFSADTVSDLFTSWTAESVRKCWQYVVVFGPQPQNWKSLNFILRLTWPDINCKVFYSYSIAHWLSADMS